MLEKIWNSMIYGNARTKVFLWSVFLMGLASIALILTAAVLSMPMVGLAGAGIGLVGFITSQSVSLNDLSRERKKKSKGKKDRPEAIPAERGSSPERDGAEAGEEPGDREASRKQRERKKAQFLASINEKNLKKIMRQHKVNQVHVKVMIDSYPAKRIEQAPAFMWRTDTMLHFMVLTGKAEEFEVPLEDIKGILLVKDVPVNPDKDYMPFQYSSYLAKMFQPYLPEYFEGTRDGNLEVKKNTFRIEPGIYLTNSSVGNLRRVLMPWVAFLVDDQVTASRRFNEYFKELYRESVLCKNMVITLEEYRKKIEETLDAMLDAPMTGKEFVNTVYDLNKYRLISREYVVRYTQKYREKHM